MSRFLVNYKLPEQDRGRVVEAPSPEIGAKMVRDANPLAQNIVVEDIEDEEQPPGRQVYQWCALCELPIWVTDEAHTYDLLSDESDTWAHTECAKGTAS